MNPIKVHDWYARFSKADARQCSKMHWFGMPTEFDGLFLRRIASNPNAADILAGYLLILQIASRAPREHRGEVVDSRGMPLTVEDLALMTGFPESTFHNAIAYLSQPAVGELIADTLTAHCQSTVSPTDSALSVPLTATGQDITGQDKDNTPTDVGVQGVSLALTPAAAPTSEGFALALESGTAPTPKKPRKPKPAELPLEEWLASLAANPANKGKDVPHEWAKMLMWCEINHAQPTRRRFIRWLLKADRTEGRGAARPAQHRPIWRIEKDITEASERIETIRDGIPYHRIGTPGAENALGEGAQRELADLRAKKARLLDELDAANAANPAPSRAVS